MSVRESRKGSWEFMVWAPTPGGGRRQVRRKGFPTRKAARNAEAALRTEIARGNYVLAENVTLGDYLTHTWLVSKRQSVKPTTIAAYEMAVRVYICPAIGLVKLRDLDGTMLSRLYATLRTEGRRQRAGGLSPKTVANVAGVMHKALADAVRWGVLPLNPASTAEKPRAAQSEMVVWSAAQLATFLRSVEGDRFAGMWRLAAMTGMRRAELCGLRWSDVDLDAARLAVISTRTVVRTKVVEGTPKTRAGSRLLSLDDKTVAAIRSWRAIQAGDRLAVGSGWCDTGLVFTKPDGTGVPPQWVSREFQRLSRRAGLRVIRLHDVRHSYITAALSVARVPVKVISQRVGHSNVGTTLNLYAHVLPGDDEAAAEAVARAVEQSW